MPFLLRYDFLMKCNIKTVSNHCQNSIYIEMLVKLFTGPKLELPYSPAFNYNVEVNRYFYSQFCDGDGDWLICRVFCIIGATRTV